VKRGEELIEAHSFTEQELHVHFPEGATPKDGPSAGVTLYCALYSLMSGRALREDVAMTGECTLQGRVLAVGGLKEKLLAAQRGGMTRVILPEENRDEVMGFEPVTRGELELVWVTRADEALEAALS
jgi:ATP-dependent Lon protease